MDSMALQGWDDARADAAWLEQEGDGATRPPAPIGAGPDILLRAPGTPASGRAALALTAQIPDPTLAADLAEQLFLAVEAVQILVELGGSDSPVLDSWRADALRVASRIEAATPG